MNKELFSVILLHYNQPRYIKNAINSIFKQNYENIEVIIADDASNSIDFEAIKAYVNENKKENIKNVEYSINEKNLGTVKTINRALKKCNGKYLLLFAADDSLCDENVLTNYYNAFKDSSDDTFMISSQCYMMDEKMEETFSTFVRLSYANSFNKMTAKEQFKIFCNNCFLAMGATAMRFEMFDKFGTFNEEYKYVEDWSYYLHLTRNGGRIKYVDFDGLLHRDGGVSHYVDNELPKHVLEFRYDLLKIMENEVLPFLDKKDSEHTIKVLQYYLYNYNDYRKNHGTGKLLPKIKFFSMFPSFVIHKALYPFINDWNCLVKAFRFSVNIAILYISFYFMSKSFPFVAMDVLKQILEYLAILIVLYEVLIVLFRLMFKILSKMKKILKRKNNEKR